MREEEKIFAGVLFSPDDPELRAIKLRTHNLCSKYNRTFEDETGKREELIRKIFCEFGENGFCRDQSISTMENTRKLALTSMPTLI